VLLVGGPTAEILHTAQFHSNRLLPGIDPPDTIDTGKVEGGRTAAVDGHDLQPAWETSGSTSTNHPIALWMPLDAGPIHMGATAPFSDVKFDWHVPNTALHGPGRLFVSSAGLRSLSVPVTI